MPVPSRPLIIITVLLYFGVVSAIGFWSLRRTRNSRDFFIAGQRLGLLVTGLAAMSSSFSGFVFVGGPGLFYQIGLASLFINVPLGLTGGLMCWVVARPLRSLAGTREVFTIPDALLCRFSRHTAGAGAIAVLLGTIGYLGSQLLAAGRLIESIFGTREIFGGSSLVVAMGTGLAIVLFYSVAGGMLAGVYTDVFQGSLMMLAACAVFYQAVSVGGGIPKIVEAVSNSPAFGPGFLEPLGRVPLFTAMGFFFVFSIGTLGQPHVLHKFYMLKDPSKLKWMPAIIGGSQSLCLLIWLGIGLTVPALVAAGRMEPLALPDDAAPLFLLNFAPELLGGIVVAGILAAIMSTADSFLNIGSAALVRDLPAALGLKVRHELYWGRFAVVGIAIVSAVFAFLYDDLIALLGTLSFGTFAAALAPTLAVGLNWRRVSSRAATASILTGLICNLGLEILSRQTLFEGLPQPPLAAGVIPGAFSLSLSFAVLLAICWFEKEDSNIESDIASALEI